MHQELAIGVDLGATKIATALVTRAGEMLKSRQTQTLVADGPGGVFDRIASEVRALLDGAPGEVVGVGIGSAGMIDAASGVVKWALNLGWKDVPLTSEVSRRLNGLRVFADNDANVNALGEGYFGSAIGCRNYILLTVGSGLGSGLVHEGRLVNGMGSLVSNLGHYALDPEHGLPCGCGNRGCAETIVGGPALIAMTRAMLADSLQPSSLRGAGELTTNQILTAARASDALASAAISRMGRAIGEIAAIATAVLGPEVIVMGGGLGVAAIDLLEPHVMRELSRRLPQPQQIPPIRAATLASPAIGCASLVWSRLATAALSTSTPAEDRPADSPASRAMKVS